MKHVVALDVSMGKSAVVIYNANREHEYEGELEHTQPAFEAFVKSLIKLRTQDGQTPEIVFEATGVYSTPLERCLETEGFNYYKINPLEANFQMERRPAYQKDSYYDQMRVLTRYYDELDSEITLLYNRMHSISQLSFPDVGIDIMRYQSGRTYYKDKINKRGNNKLRKILFYMIQTMIKLHCLGRNHFVEYYDKLKKQPYNKCHKVASIACVNKFLKVAFHLITHNLTPIITKKLPDFHNQVAA